MCETLRVSPNELLGFADPGTEHPFESTSGLAEAAADEIAQTAPRDQGTHEPDPISSLAWRLAAEVVAIRHEQPGKRATSDALEIMRETGALFRSLQRKPYEMAADLAADPILARVDSRRRAALAGLIRAYTDSVSEARPARPRSR